MTAYWKGTKYLLQSITPILNTLAQRWGLPLYHGFKHLNGECFILNKRQWRGLASDCKKTIVQMITTGIFQCKDNLCSPEQTSALYSLVSHKILLCLSHSTQQEILGKWLSCKSFIILYKIPCRHKIATAGDKEMYKENANIHVTKLGIHLQSYTH